MGEIGVVLSEDAGAAQISYSLGVLKDFMLNTWRQPPVENPPPRGVNDWIIVGVLVVASIIEPFFRDDLWAPPLAVFLGIVSVFALLWRRSNPLAATIVAFSGHALSEIIPALAGEDESIFLYSGLLYALLLPYSLLRWGSGRHGAYGLAFIIVSHMFAHPLTWTDAAFVVVFFMFPAEVGASVRYRETSKKRQIEQIKLEERQQLARELHDTVAHHVSAIAVRAQAGRVLAEANPDGALAALNVIENEASKTLDEMRAMVGVLRSSEVADLAPQPGVGDLAQFARNGAESPKITVHVSAEAGQPSPPIGAAIYRIAQESITNALRHASHPSEIYVSVDGDGEFVRLSVRDDGQAIADPRSTEGFGVVGMKERAKLLGGTLVAGPENGQGWKVEAVLPRIDVAK